jgi:O-antigen/teichoic acid export membrane protein
MTSTAVNTPTYAAPAACPRPVPAQGKRLLGAGAVLILLALLDQGVVSAARFLTNVIIGRVCGKEELGLYALGFSVLLLIVCAQEALVTTPYTVFGNRLQGARRAARAASALLQHGLLTLVCVIGGVLGAVVLFAANQRQMAWVVLAIALGIAGTLMREFARRVALAHLSVGAATLVDSVFAVLCVGGLLLAARWGVLSAEWAYLIVGVACAAVAMGWLLASRDTFRRAPGSFQTDCGETWRFGRWVFAGQIVLAASTALLPWLAAAARGSAEAGALSACLQIVLLTNPLVIAAGSLLTPQAARAAAVGPRAVRAVTRPAAWWLAAAMSAFCLLVLLGGERAMSLVYGGQFQGYGHTLAVLALAALATAVALPDDVGLQAIQRPDVNLRANVLGLLATLAVAGLAVGPLGVLGIAYGWLAGCTLASTWRMIGFARASAAAEGGAA